MASIGSWCKYLKFRIMRLPWDALERLAGKAYDISRAVGMKKLSVAIWNKWLYDLLCVPDTPEERALHYERTRNSANDGSNDGADRPAKGKT